MCWKCVYTSIYNDKNPPCEDKNIYHCFIFVIKNKNKDTHYKYT